MNINIKEKKKKIILTVVTLLLISIIIGSLAFYFVNKNKNKEILLELSNFSKVTLNSYLNNDFIDNELLSLLNSPGGFSQANNSYYALIFYFAQHPLAKSVDSYQLSEFAKNSLNTNIDTMLLSSYFTSNENPESTQDSNINGVIEKDSLIKSLQNTSSVISIFYDELYYEPDGSYKIVANIVKLNSFEEIEKYINENPDVLQNLYNQINENVTDQTANTSETHPTDDMNKSTQLNEIISTIGASKLLNKDNYKALSTPLCTMNIIVNPTSNNLDVQSIEFIDLSNQGV